ncbi:two-component sensor histidine kinase BarA [Rheinheimera tilapiae]|uniref:histidine kinase n=1 Tax=Rheinheimera tilapiae TaxID=875043 RepID=A0ABV6BD96_9GAMM
MTKIALRDWILLITLLPTLLASAGLGGYFSYMRFADLSRDLADQASNIAEPLAIASAYGLLADDKAYLQRLVNVSHRKNSPRVRTIAVFDHRHQLIASSNLHKDFADLHLPAKALLPDLPQIVQQDNYLLIRAPIQLESSEIQALALSARSNDTQTSRLLATEGRLGYVLVQVDKDKVMLAQQSSMLVTILLVLLALSLALMLSLRLLSRLSQPLQQLILQIERLAEGRFEKHLDQPFIGEFDLMRLGVNQLANELKHYKDEMQHAVDQSTSDLVQTMEQLEMQNVALDMARRKAQDDNRLKSEFLAKMSHELRTPLNGVLGFTRQLLKTQLTHHQQDYLNTIQKSANSLLSLVNDVLDYAKLEEGRMPINPEPFSIRDLVYDAVELLSVNAFDKQLELALQIDADVPDSLIGDPLRINQILMNIAGNAIKFTEHGSIVIRLQHQPSTDDAVLLHFEVQDTGIGIAPAQQEQLFHGFAQADGSIGRRYGGTGLGLIISQRLVAAMGGQIGFHSKATEGSTFWFSLALPAHPLSASEPLPVALLTGKTVLYIEPQQYSRESTLSLLNSWGMQVSACATPGQLQQALAQQDQFDIALIGRTVSLDQLNSIIELIRQIKPHCQYLYLLVNSLSPNLREALLQSGAMACLAKPAHQRKLAATLARPYNQHQAVALPSPTAPKARLRVLTVDDNDANLKLINTLLGELVESVDSASQGAEAWQLASHVHYDIIFMDINMPVMDGITACQRIQQSSLNEDTPIIAVTAHTLPGERERLLGLGFCEFLSKPLDEQMLQYTLKECCPAFSQTSMQPVYASTEPATEVPALPQSRHVDWELALQRAAGKTELAREMLQLLLASLPQTLADLEKYRESNQRDALIQLVHKLHGATCYTGVPHIKALSETIETQLKTGASLLQLEPELFDLTDQLQDLLAESLQWSQ